MAPSILSIIRGVKNFYHLLLLLTLSCTFSGCHRQNPALLDMKPVRGQKLGAFMTLYDKYGSKYGDVLQVDAKQGVQVKLASNALNAAPIWVDRATVDQNYFIKKDESPLGDATKSP